MASVTGSSFVAERGEVRIGDLFTVETLFESNGYQVVHVSSLGTRVVGHKHIRRNGISVLKPLKTQTIVWRKTTNATDKSIAWKWVRSDYAAASKYTIKFGLAFNYHKEPSN
jgi:hypothetical protein